MRVLEPSRSSAAGAGLARRDRAGRHADAASLRRAVEGVDAVVHLVAIITGKPEEFAARDGAGTRDLVAAAQEAGVRRFVLMSALGATEETKDLVPYYRAKWEMEQTVRASGSST